MPFWSKGKDSLKPLSSAAYDRKASALADKAMKIVDILGDMLSRPNVNQKVVLQLSHSLREIAEEHRSLVVTDEESRKHQIGYYRVLDLQARKAEDIVQTGGINLEALGEEEEALAAETQAKTDEMLRDLKAKLEKTGMELPDFGQSRRH